MSPEPLDDDQKVRSFEGRLVAACKSIVSEGAVSGLRRLTGGANMETWAFDVSGVALILRRMPEGMIDLDRASSIPIELEAELISAVSHRGVRVPDVRVVLTEEDELRRGYIMSRLEGETLPKRIQTDSQFIGARKRFVTDAVAQLAKIHATPLTGALTELRHEGPSEAIKSIRHNYDRFGGGSILFEAAFAWLESHQPKLSNPSLVHGDFRIGNLLVTEDGINGVLDWEQAHLGDPVRDLAYMCVPSWRFAGYDKPVAGLADIEDLLDAYEAEANVEICRDRFVFWLILGTLWWGVVCMEMIFRWRTGADRVLEKAVIGNRVSEVELDLLLLLEGGSAPASADLEFTEPSQVTQYGRTEPLELAVALSEWVSTEVLPNAKGSEKFDALVARNCLGMLRRSSQLGSHFEERRRDRLTSLEITQEELLGMAKKGSLDLRNANLLRHLRFNVLEQISIDQPKYPGFLYAKNKWSAHCRAGKDSDV